MTGESLIRTVRQAKIVGGTFAERGEFPHQVYLSYHDEFVCGGSILSTLLILTAAHCVKYKRPNRLKITAGVYDRSITGSEQTRTARYIYMHENYVWETDINDIAIIVLAEPLQFTRNVQNISLPREKEEFYGYATVSGWGRTKEKGETTNVLKKVRLPLVDNDECQRRYRKVKMKVTENMLCAGDVGLDACQGDSGGPAICKNGNDNEVICGIISHGYGCGRRGYPGIYTKVANYLDWIKKTQEKIIARGKCRSDHFYCSSGPGCIPRTFLCDLESDCGGDNAEDEQGCIYMTNCRRNQFRCNNGRCIKQDYLCDAMDDCGDRSDEDKCPTESKLCVDGQHQCGVGGRCIPDEWKCDSEQDCDDNSDEEGCIYNNSTINTAENEIDNFYIKTSTTLAPCTSEQFYCARDYRCIPVRWRCDGDRDCRSGADEIGCSNENVENSVTSTSSAPEVITSPPITTTEITTSTLSSRKNCSQGQFQCDDGTCISNVFQCDFDFDCEDHSDEDPAHCPAYETTCFSYFWRCNNGQCIYRKFRCDGDSDCTDNSDEQNCRIYNMTVNSSRRRRNRRRG